VDSTVQSLLYPNSDEHVWDILYRIFYRPYLIVFQHFDTDELDGTVRSCSLFIDNLITTECALKTTTFERLSPVYMMT